MARRSPDSEINMTPMIDVVFQLIIFFIVTIKMDRDMINEKILLAKAPHGPAIEQREPKTVIIEVDDRGVISIMRTPMSQRQLRGIMQQTVNLHGFQVPVLVRGDKNTKHEDVRKVMDACAAVGLWKIKFAAIKKPARATR